MANPLAALFSRRGRRAVTIRPPRRSASLAPAVVLAAGAGAALWWWTQWAQGGTESASGAPAEDTKTPLSMSPVLDPEAAKTLDETLAVQADEDPDTRVTTA